MMHFVLTLWVLFLGALVFGWLAYCTWCSKLPLLGDIVSSKFFVPFGRLSYATFMIHYLYIWYENFTLRDPIEYRKHPMAMRILSTLVVSQILGYFAYLVIEAPMLNMLKSAFLKKETISMNGTMMNNNEISKTKTN